MLMTEGEIIHVVTRRRFEADVRRHFVGQVVEQSGDVARVEGYAFIFEPTRNEYIKRPQARIRLIALGDAGNVINILPEGTNLEALHYECTKNKRLVLTDDGECSLDVQEYGSNR
jgi:hypothetical protein